MRGSEGGQATIEWAGAVLVVAMAFGAALTVAPHVDGRSFGGFLAHHLACTVRGGCGREDDPLREAYGGRDAELVRLYAPNLVYEPGTLTLPVDFRDCRAHRCSDAPDRRDLDVHRSGRGGVPATAFTRVVRNGGETFIQYWLYYPDSTSTVGGLAGIWNRGRGLLGEYPGHHADDWESYQVRIDASGRVWARSSSHHGYQGCKQGSCKNRWVPWTGWTRVSRGSHAGHIPMRTRRRGLRPVPAWPPEVHQQVDLLGPEYPGTDFRERTTTSEGLRLVPLESIDSGRYRPLDEDIVPPWGKDVYEEPRSDSTS